MKSCSSSKVLLVKPPTTNLLLPLSLFSSTPSPAGVQLCMHTGEQGFGGERSEVGPKTTCVCVCVCVRERGALLFLPLPSRDHRPASTFSSWTGVSAEEPGQQTTLVTTTVTFVWKDCRSMFSTSLISAA
ncbi:hypothetical protein IE53DRAFT_283307 [Violaceomyces palustris]|uniref:Uncharacterized protein n=1 Tax=Violaceomyces palustris TaxID=1673888 RepID=A0ACD0NM86_9BASI|nr:hypothetical protein IE53DRAFT_283307 [Violaceomyces palustris]